MHIWLAYYLTTFSWFCGVTVSTQDSESCDPSSNLGRTFNFKLLNDMLFIYHMHVHVIVKERHETIMGYKPRERVALVWFIPIIVELLVL